MCPQPISSTLSDTPANVERNMRCRFIATKRTKVTKISSSLFLSSQFQSLSQVLHCRVVRRVELHRLAKRFDRFVQTSEPAQSDAEIIVRVAMAGPELDRAAKMDRRVFPTPSRDEKSTEVVLGG